MVDRIDKIKPSDYWKIQETKDPKKDKQQDQSSEGENQSHSSFEERVDFDHLLPKTSGKIGNLFGSPSPLKKTIVARTTTSKPSSETKQFDDESEITLIRKKRGILFEKLRSLLGIQTILYLAILFLLVISLYFIFRILMK